MREFEEIDGKLVEVSCEHIKMSGWEPLRKYIQGVFNDRSYVIGQRRWCMNKKCNHEELLVEKGVSTETLEQALKDRY